MYLTYHIDRCVTAVVVQFQDPKQQPSREALLKLLRELAQDSRHMRMDNPHVKHRMDLRHVTMRQVLDVVRNGEVVSGPTLDKYGDWRLKLKRLTAGRRVQVVVAITPKHFSVVTVI